MVIIENFTLSTSQKSLINKFANYPFQLGSYSSLDDILTKLNVTVIIEPGIITRTTPPDALLQARDYWEQEYRRLQELANNRLIELENNQDFDEIDVIPEAEMRREAERNLDIISMEVQMWSSMTLRGLYDPEHNVIKLYPEEMATEYSGKRMDELLVSTLAHETMHAYFNRPRKRRNYPYVLQVEEPLAEFGMLLHLYGVDKNFYDWAYQDVSRKRTCYHYGAQLMDQYLKGDNANRDYLEEYKINLPVYGMLKIDPVDGTISMPIIIGVRTRRRAVAGAPLDLDRMLQTVGMGWFVELLPIVAKYPKHSTNDIIDIIDAMPVQPAGWNIDQGKRTRINETKRILNNGLAGLALDRVIASTNPRVGSKTRLNAVSLRPFFP